MKRMFFLGLFLTSILIQNIEAASAAGEAPRLSLFERIFDCKGQQAIHEELRTQCDAMEKVLGLMSSRYFERNGELPTERHLYFVCRGLHWKDLNTVEQVASREVVFSKTFWDNFQFFLRKEFSKKEYVDKDIKELISKRQKELGKSPQEGLCLDDMIKIYEKYILENQEYLLAEVLRYLEDELDTLIRKRREVTARSEKEEVERLKAQEKARLQAAKEAEKEEERRRKGTTKS